MGDSELVGSVTARDDDTSLWIDASAPWLEPSTYAVADDSSLTGTTTGVRDTGRTAHLRVDADTPAGTAASWATLKDMQNGMVGKPAAAGAGAAALRYDLDAGETVTFTARMGDAVVPEATRTTQQTLGLIDAARRHVDDRSVHGSGEVGRATTFMRDAMALNANYDEKYDRSFVMWGLGGGGDDIFKGWDSGWDGITANSLDPALALDHVRDFYDQGGGPRYDQGDAAPCTPISPGAPTPVPVTGASSTLSTRTSRRTSPGCPSSTPTRTGCSKARGQARASVVGATISGSTTARSTPTSSRSSRRAPTTATTPTSPMSR